MANKQKTIFNYDPEVYTPRALRKNLTPAQARQEYSRLRSIALKRIQRFEGTEYSDAQILREFPASHFLKVSDIHNDRVLYYLLADTARFLKSKRSTISGQKEIEKKTLETLRRRNYGFVTPVNLRDFGRYMELVKAQSTATYFDSIRAAELFRDALEDRKSIDEIAETFLAYEQEAMSFRAKGGRGGDAFR